MSRKYPEKVSAKMLRMRDDDGEVLILRQSTVIHFGESEEHLGTIIMTNPGRFEFKKSPGWEPFKKGEGTSDSFESEDYPDLSMQNVIKVMRAGFENAGLGRPEGTVKIFNISNIRQPDGGMAEAYHRRALNILGKNNEDMHLLEDPVTNSKADFLWECSQSKFVMMGFVDGAFENQVNNILEWSNSVENIRVCAIDEQGRYSHPRRWRTEPYLMDRAIESMITVLKG